MDNNTKSSAHCNLGHLLPQHLADLRKSGLTDDTILAARFTSVTDAATISRILNWNRSGAVLGACLKIPFFDRDGQLTDYARLKPDKPRPSKDGNKPVKYESPCKRGNHLYVPPAARAALQTAGACIRITEGEKKALAATQADLPTLALTGVWNWQKKRTDKDSPRELIDDLARENWQGRPVVIAFDSDIADKPEIQWAEYYLAETLTKAGADVKAIRLPPGPNGEKQGLDDFLVAKGDAGPAALEELLASAAPVSKPEDKRPLVLLTTQEHITVRQAIEALVERDAELYQKGNILVRLTVPRRAPQCTGVKFSNLPTAEPVPEANLRTRISFASTATTGLAPVPPKSGGSWGSGTTRRSSAAPSRKRWARCFAVTILTGPSRLLSSRWRSRNGRTLDARPRPRAVARLQRPVRVAGDDAAAPAYRFVPVGLSRAAMGLPAAP
jgi:hypothetical protein